MMKMRFGRVFHLPTISPYPPGMVADRSANFGKEALHANIETYCGRLESIVTAGTNLNVTATQCRRRWLYLTSGASGGFTITLPSTNSILAALNNLGNTIPTDGTYGQEFTIVNVGIGQTGTLTAGDASTTITGTATIATNTTRTYVMMVTAATTITYYNIGSLTL